MSNFDDLSRSFVPFEQGETLIAVVEMSLSSWLVSGLIPGVDRKPLKKLEPDAPALLRLLECWRDEALKAGRTIKRIVLAYEAGRDGFWLAWWLRARAWRLMSFIRRASQCRASIGGRKRIGSTPRF